MKNPDISTILKLTVPVIVQVGKQSVPMSEVIGLAPGSLLELTKHSDDNLDLLVNNKVVGSGEAVKVGENFGIEIKTIKSPQERVQALGSDE